MKMMRRVGTFLPLGLIIITIAITVYFYPQLPARIVYRIDFRGRPVEAGPRSWFILAVIPLSEIAWFTGWRYGPLLNLARGKKYVSDHLTMISIVSVLYVLLMSGCQLSIIFYNLR